MDEARKNAYRRILYAAMLDFRAHGVVGPQHSVLHVWRWPGALRRLREIQEPANWLHNLAMFAGLDFERFDEIRFWREYESLIGRFPSLAGRLSYVRHNFENDWSPAARSHVKVRSWGLAESAIA